MKKISCLVLFLMMASNVFALDDVWNASEPVGSTRYVDLIDDYVIANNNSLQRLLSRYRQGCLITYNSAAQVTIGLGEIMATDATTYRMLKNAAATTVTWADIDTGAEAASTTYYVYGGTTSTTTTSITFKISTNSTTPTGLTYFRRLGTFYNNADSNITKITNDNYFTGLGDWVSRTPLTVYQATTDGFVIIGKNSNDDQVGIYTDSSNPPTTWRGGNRSAVSQVCCPVKRGDYYKGYHVASYPADFMYWIPNGE